MQPTTSQKTAVLALRSPALLVALMVVHGDCSNVSQMLLRIVSDAGWSNDSWPQIITDFPECFGVVLCLVMLIASEENLLRLYNVVLPAMALILTNFVITQSFLERTYSGEPPAPPPTHWWSQLVAYLSGIVEYFVGKDKAPAVDVEDVSYDCVLVMIQLALASGLVHFITVSSSTVEKITLTTLINLFIVPCSMKLVGASQSDVDLANTLVCRTVCLGMELWSTLCLERMLYTAVRQNHLDVGWTSVELWQRVRRPLFASWLVAYSTQFADSLMAADVSDLTYTEMMLSNLRHRSWTPMMYLGLCSAVSYLTDTVWKLIYLVVARSAARQNVTDNGLSEVLTLIHTRLLCFLLGMSTADMFPFVIPYLTGILTVRWIFLAVKALLLSDDRRTHVRACLIYLATIVALPCLVLLGVAGEKRIYVAGNLFIALRFSIRGTSTLIQSLVRRWYAAPDHADDLVFFIRTVAGVLRVCLGCYVVFDLVYLDAVLLHAVMLQPGLVVRAEFMRRWACVLIQTYLQAWLLVAEPLRRVVDSLQKHYGAAGRVVTLPTLPLDDHRLQDPCAVCLTPMDVDSSRLTPCGHAFHGKCLELSLRVSRYCPICRHQLLGDIAQ